MAILTSTAGNTQQRCLSTIMPPKAQHSPQTGFTDPGSTHSFHLRPVNLESHRSMNSSLFSPTTLATYQSTSKISLPPTSSETISLRRDHGHWRTHFIQQATQPLYCKKQLDALHSDEDEAALQVPTADVKPRDTPAPANTKTHGNASLATESQLASIIHDQGIRIRKLQRSDRAKGPVNQRNLALKAFMGAQSAAAKNKNADGGVDQSLRVILVAALERIDELEEASEGLLDALDEEGDVSDEDEEDDREGGRGGGERRLEAEIVLSGVIEDGTFRELRERLGEVLVG
ncbi:hypothetical protein K504DRAFT_495950 [Pleomassaria siparia CBS 279.74]|uniref:Uncharacterized protein n=1 Tax=Pleomassaria siparia CBS 279.74 TaxID=1314801 RepID=A0A6G1JQK5_9PLEO|nr:hypothetical protein K504DRAFT_495950 [Pleomassaria siparia CBS 279.74]